MSELIAIPMVDAFTMSFSYLPIKVTKLVQFQNRKDLVLVHFIEAVLVRILRLY